MPFRRLDGVARHITARWNALSPGEKLFVLWLTPGLPPPGPFGAEERQRALRAVTPAMRASAYIDKGRLVILGVQETEFAAVPFSYAAKVEGEAPDGPVDLHSDKHPQAVIEAIEKARRPIMHKIEGEAMKAGAETLVERARSGDQIAEATLQLVGENARKGEKRARHAYKLIELYIEEHPMEGGAGTGAGLGHAHGEDDSICPPKSDTVGAEFGTWHGSLRKAVFGGEKDAGDEQATSGVLASIRNAVVPSSPVAVPLVAVTVANAGKASLKMLGAAAAETESALKYGASVAMLIPGIGANIASSLSAAGVLARGRPINNEALKATAGALPSGNVKLKNGKPVPMRDVFRAGIKHSANRAKIQSLAAGLPPEGKRTLQVGYTLGVARQIQAVRGGNGFMSDMAMWELT